MQRLNQGKANYQVGLFVGLSVLILSALTILGGIPTGDKLPIFTLGTVLTIVISAVIALAGWHLLFRPLPQGHKVVHESLLKGQARHLVGLLMAIGLANIAIASIWDEIWHRVYGIPFGDDFFWRPHQMMYFGFLVFLVVAAWGFFAILKHGKGTMQQRFRTDPAIGFAILTGTYLAFALPADPVWHELYGTDLTAWSLPHVILLVLVLAMGVASVAIQVSAASERQWGVLKGLAWRDALIIISMAMVLIAFIIVLTVEWYGESTFADDFIGFMSQRPDWLLSFLTSLTTVLMGTIALHASKRIGTAFLVGLVALGTRYAFENILGASYSGITPYALILPILLTLELCHYAYYVRQAKMFNLWFASLMVGLLAGLGGYFVINSLFIYPELSLSSIPMSIIVNFLAAAIALWLGQIIGGFLAGLQQGASEAVSEKQGFAPLLDGLVYAGFAAFAVFLMFTAAPPI